MPSTPAPSARAARSVQPRGFFGVDDDVMAVDRHYLGTKPQMPTKYPIVLLHGFLGWDLIDRILKETGSAKVNIIAHSMGGLGARYLIGQGFSDKIASLTTIGMPHRGTPVPDLIFGILGSKSPLFKAFEYLVAGVLGRGSLRPSELNLKKCLRNASKSLSNDYFNPNCLNSPNVYYQSYAGVTSLTGIKTGDIIDPLLTPFLPSFQHAERSDGWVTTSSAQWGRFRGIV